jgi:predicted regulator of Ras-like GTPase activity (Roadblock/LC7/MglB family)
MTTAATQLGRTDQIQDVLRRLRMSSTEVSGVALVSTEGFMAASLLPNEVEEEVVAGMAAALLGAADRVSVELMGSPATQTCVKSEHGYIVLNQVGSDAMLVVLASENAKLGLLFLDIKRHLNDLIELL